MFHNENAARVYMMICVKKLSICIFVGAMFLAIIIPAAKKSKPVTQTIIIAAALSFIFYFSPFLNRLSSGWVIIICGIGSSAFSALKYPVVEVQNEQ